MSSSPSTARCAPPRTSSDRPGPARTNRPPPCSGFQLYPQPKEWGDNSQRLDTEDIDGDGQLRNQSSYYEFTADIKPVTDPQNDDFQPFNFELSDAVARAVGAGPPDL